jgi:hypothetical protein
MALDHTAHERKPEPPLKVRIATTALDVLSEGAL